MASGQRRTAYADLTIEIHSMRWRSVKDLPKIASRAPCYRVRWKRGHHGSGETQWVAPLPSAPGKGDFRVDWNYREVISAAHLPRAGCIDDERKRKLLVFEVQQMSGRGEEKQTETIGVVSFPLEFSDEHDGRLQQREDALVREGASQPFAFLKTSYLTTSLSVEEEAVVRSQRAQSRSQGSPSPARDRAHAAATELPPFPPPPPVDPDSTWRAQRRAAAAASLLLGGTESASLAGASDEERLQVQIQRVHAQIFSQLAAISAKRRDVQFLRERHAVLCADYAELRQQLETVDRACADRGVALERERVLAREVAELRDEVTTWREREKAPEQKGFCDGCTVS
eukprot:TRINITY_DN16703_c0_g1_i1.p1 TRINITY_DN16703_c0_g1~~TRINITY_DN16703_c0_g1_i1.p1  ORF type:complete len:373 (+),score=114.09 TRINITY_DN16703_c0_g1_i1:96-1121(+)